jgi:two-component system, OmpR family, sensor histidine kinase BaeS
VSSRASGRRLLRRLFTGQVLVILVGGVTLALVAFLAAPPIFADHVERAVGGLSSDLEDHLGAALAETLLVTLTFALVTAAVAAAVVSWLLAVRIARPVEELTRTADALATGHLDARARPLATDDELADLAVTFNAMAETLQHTEDTRRGLLADLAHELRTPLATIEAHHEGLADGVLTADPDTLQVLADATGRLQRLVEDLALVSRAEEGSLPLQRAPIDLRDVVAAAVEAARPAAGTQEVLLAVTADKQPCPVDADRDRLTQVLTNLLDNALAHTPPGGRIDLSCRREDGEVLVEVTDTGSGIAPEHLGHVFHRFYRADPSRPRHAGGSGIGLTISRAIVRRHDGELTATSAGEGLGATFTLRLPAAGRPGAAAGR